MGFSLLRVLLRSRRSPLFANTQAGARFADNTRQALALAQRWTHRPHVMVYAGGSFAICATRRFVHVVLGLSPPVQARLRQWLDAHLKHVAKRE